MPIYTYRCPAGHEVELLVFPSEGEPSQCPRLPKGDEPRNPHTADGACGQPLARTLAPPADSFPGANRW